MAARTREKTKKGYQAAAGLNSRIIDGLALGISLALLAAAAAGAAYTGTGKTVAEDLVRILVTPSPTVTYYFSLGSLPACLLNVGLCGLAMSLFMVLLPGPSHGNTLAGYFLVIAHCFFGLHFLNIWPCFLTPFLYMALRRLDFKDNLHINMFATCFGPFVSELLFRYTLGARYTDGVVRLTVSGVLRREILAQGIQPLQCGHRLRHPGLFPLQPPLPHHRRGGPGGRRLRKCRL